MSQLDRILNIVKRTGDRVVFFNEAQNETFVILSLNEYENLLNSGDSFPPLTAVDDVAKIDDIDFWRKDEGLNFDQDFSETEELNKDKEDIYYHPSYLEDDGYSEEEYSPRNKKGWRIPSNRKKDAAEIIDEDRQYLEDIRF